MFYGAGSLFFATKELDASSIRGENLLLPACVAAFELSFEDNFIEAKCLEAGRRVTKASQITESIANLNLTFEVQGWSTTQLIYDEVAAASASYTLPELRIATTDGSGVINDTDITGTEVIGEDFLAYAVDGEVFLTSADIALGAGTITLAAYPNAVINYLVYVSKTAESIGVANQFDRFGRILFSGIAYSTETAPNDATLILINQMSRIASPSLTINGDLAEISIDYRPEVAVGARQAVEFYLLD